MWTSQTTLKIEKKYNVTQEDKTFLTMSKMVLKYSFYESTEPRENKLFVWSL